MCSDCIDLVFKLYQTITLQIDNVISEYCTPDHITKDQDSAFISSFMDYLLKKCNMKINCTAYNHQPLQTEHGIKSLSTILTNHLTGLGQMWPKSLPSVMLTYNAFSSPSLEYYSPHELGSVGNKNYL